MDPRHTLERRGRAGPDAVVKLTRQPSRGRLARDKMMTWYLKGTEYSSQEGTTLIPLHEHHVEPYEGERPHGVCTRIQEVLTLIGDKWTLQIMVQLLMHGGPARFNEIKRGGNGITQRMLTLKLRALERNGFLTRVVLPSTPPRVQYEVTELGKSLRAPLEGLGYWALDKHAEIMTAHARYDAALAAEPDPGTRVVRIR